MIPKTPFFEIKNFISPLLCESLVERINNRSLIKTVKGVKVVSFKDEIIANELYPRITNIMPLIEKYYNFAKGSINISLEHYPESFPETKFNFKGEDSLTAILYLCDYQSIPPLDMAYEMYGGNIFFSQWNRLIIAERGKLIVFPSNKRFNYVVRKLFAGESNIVRFDITPKEKWTYDKNNFTI